MKLIDVIKALQASGVSVTYQKRSDAGYRVTSINGVKYQAKKGNLQARAMLGSQAQISEKQRKHVKRASKAHKERAKVIRQAKKQKLPIPPKPTKIKEPKIEVSQEMRAQLRKTQSAFRKLNKVREAYGQDKAGKPTIERLRQVIKYRGREEAERALKDAERYASGRIYSGQISFLIRRIEEVSAKYDDDASELIALIRANAENFKEEHFVLFKEELYKYENRAISIKTLTLNLKQILALRIFDLSSIKKKK